MTTMVQRGPVRDAPSDLPIDIPYESLPVSLRQFVHVAHHIPVVVGRDQQVCPLASREGPRIGLFDDRRRETRRTVPSFERIEAFTTVRDIPIRPDR